MRRLLPLLSLAAFALAGGARAQTPDTTDWRSYFPLEVGNAWQYHVTDEIGSGYYGYEVTHDTLIEGRTYYAVRSCSPGLCYDGSPVNPYFELRYDTTHALVVEWLEFTNGTARDGWWYPVPCALDAPFDAFTECTGPDAGEEYYVTGGSGYDLVLPPDTVQGVTYKQFDSIPVVMGAVAGFGVVSRQQVKNPPFAYERLVWARVGGVEYGTQAFPFPPVVAAEPAPEADDAFALAVHPNPARGRATASFVLPSAGAVRAEAVDLLGRRVLTRDLGALPAGRHEASLDLRVLPPGAYAVRLHVAGRPLGVRLLTVVR